MKVGIIGTGYVGLPTGVGLAELGHDVVCIDKDIAKIKTLQSGKATLYEEGLDELLQKNFSNNKIKFTTSMEEGIKGADVVLLAVGTPPHPVTKEADLQYIFAAAEELAEYLTGYTVVAVKSTVPVGTGDKVETLIKKTNPTADVDIISVPEFLREGYAVKDFFNPDRIVIGSNTERAKKVMAELYSYFADKTEILYVNRRSSETIKYASNAFLAVKIHYINEMANFCEQTGADINEVAKGMGLDKRIGNRFLNAGPGYGGSCFPKDTMAMAYIARQYGVNMSIIENVIKENANRKKQMAHRILETISDIPQARIAVLGLAFKEGTDDCRESPAMDIINELLAHGATITAYDPQAMENAKKILGEKISYAPDAYSATEKADALAILTEWPEFKSLNLNKVSICMKNKNIVDCRNMLNKEQAVALGFNYSCIGYDYHVASKYLKQVA
ncbi:MAG: UDP-glucose/GDP-mannose dehydrogenase family protein [Alphaproteobacteria bacterium]|nr:UDP-glucose/GDP-mannose dehydrogenase family protein [Alphaproteobacteria bacterium]